MGPADDVTVASLIDFLGIEKARARAVGNAPGVFIKLFVDGSGIVKSGPNVLFSFTSFSDFINQAIKRLESARDREDDATRFERLVNKNKDVPF